MAGADRSRSLQQAASLLFVIMAVLPLLIFMWVLYRLEVLSRHEAQIGLGLALVMALAGFFIFRSLMAQLSEFVKAMVRAVETRDRGRPLGAGTGPGRAPVLPRVAAPGIGSITELGDLTATMGAMWAREAAPYVGQRVLVSVVRATEPVTGTLREVTSEGLLVEDGGTEVAISYSRISSIEHV